MKREFCPTPENAGERLDLYLAAQLSECSRAYLQKVIRSGRVTVNGAPGAPRTPVAAGAKIVVELPEVEAPAAPRPEDFAFPILYEDDCMVVINKPAGVVVHPAPGNPDGTVVNALLGRYPELRSTELPDDARPGIVHRLDKDTSGCLAAARTPEAQSRLAAAFAERKTAKVYLALTSGIPKEARGRIENLIGRHPVNRQKMAIVRRNGKPAVSEYEVLRRGTLDKHPVALIRVRIYTGRTHQIRVHLASLGCPVLGDALYGGARVIGAPRQMLHAWKLSIPHPASGEMIHCQAPVPEDFRELGGAIDWQT